jgi:hypothetical protein
VARTIVELLEASGSTPPVVNLVHPRPTPWLNILNAIRGALAQNGFADVLTKAFNEWIETLEKLSDNASGETFEQIVSNALLDLYECAHQ